jgi:hypothetical protein
MKKKHLFFVFVLITGLCVTFGVVNSLYSSAKEPLTKNTDKSFPQLSTIRVTLPTDTTIWFTGKKYEIHYELVNIKTAHWVRLLKGGQVIGSFAGGNDIGSTTIKLAITCGGPLLNGVKYGPGNDYQVEVATADDKIKSQSRGTFRINKTLEPIGKTKASQD